MFLIIVFFFNSSLSYSLFTATWLIFFVSFLSLPKFCLSSISPFFFFLILLYTVFFTFSTVLFLSVIPFPLRASSLLVCSHLVSLFHIFCLFFIISRVRQSIKSNSVYNSIIVILVTLTIVQRWAQVLTVRGGGAQGGRAGASSTLKRKPAVGSWTSGELLWSIVLWTREGEECPISVL